MKGIAWLIFLAVCAGLWFLVKAVGIGTALLIVAAPFVIVGFLVGLVQGFKSA